MGCIDSELSILITDDQEICELNLYYREKNKATDVLSFAMHEGKNSKINTKVLGDVVISLETADRQAKIAKESLQNQLLRLLIHGTLHLLGYDHVKVSRQKAQQMRRKERQLFKLLSYE